MSPTFLCVSEFDVKLGLGVKILKFTAVKWFFYFWFQTCHFFQRFFERILNVKFGGGSKLLKLSGCGGDKILVMGGVSSFSRGRGA